MSRVLVSGGAGYIGSHTVRLLVEAGHEAAVADNLVTGHREAVPDGVPLWTVDLREREPVRNLFREFRPDAVIHFASHCYVGESVANPRKYFEDNLGVALNLLGAMTDEGCRRIIFSSSAATYGDPRQIPIPEEHPQDPVNPYGESKFFIERILRRYDEAYGIRFAALRYFNAAGAHPDGTLGESHDPETHLIPLMVRAVMDDRYRLTLFGDDYPTPDGTCIRDYIHVLDLGDAHLRALDFLGAEDRSLAVNLGTGDGFSVREMIQQLEKVSGRKVKFHLGPRRAGDPPRLVASGEKARQLLGWRRQHSSIQTVLKTAWDWAQNPRY